MQQQLNEVAKALLEAKRIAIISHKNPDGDTLGSQLALGGALKELGKDVVLYNKDKVASKFNFIAGADQVAQYHDGMELPETVVFVDCAEPQLAGFTVEDDVLMGKTIINIDHHASNKHYGKWNYVVSTAGANCQNIYHVIGAIGGTITKEIATALYTGLSTDTGNFMFDNVSSETLRIAADLKDIGANTDAVRLKLYESSSKKKIEMLKYILNNLHISADGQYAWSSISHQMIEELQPESTDIDGLINTIKDIEGVEIAILFRGVEANRTKASLRSKVWADVNQIAGMFGGGGHVRASGVSIDGDVEYAAALMEPAVLDIIRQHSAE
ncbi:MAG: bifunctional oligoribonuclease/PAP phosphatase NrnA [Peptococcaceae bacterium]|jgi:phosphoesterase RecJ-like protein|nr:bifunctional oligoribonuclease/PAP phosphatase NrnA [Peptococcaceae bacterium]